MKKYLSLFKYYSVIFAASLITGSSSSYGMKEYEDECPDSIPFILLAGTSSAGKTTTSQKLQARCPKSLVNGRDDIISQVSPHQFDPKSIDPEEFDLRVDRYYVSHLAHWVLKHQGKPIILDVLTPRPILEILQESSTSLRPFKVLLYVPLSKYQERIRVRNIKALEEGKLEELRNPLDMALQYQDIFKVSSADIDPPLGMKITYESMKDVLNDFSQDTVKFLKSIPEEDPLEIEDEAGRQSDIKKALSHMFSSLTEGYFIPNDPYDLIIDTSTSSPSAIVEMIHKHFFEWKKE